MQQGGSQYGVPPPPEMSQFGAAGAGTRSQLLGGIPSSDHLQQLPEAVPPINSRPPQPPPSTAQTGNFDELATTVSGSIHDDEAGEEVERGAPGNRWPKEETLALIKIRSDMDATFRDATLKGPLWDEVSRKLAEMGYARSAKKCKEKFENVHKYYKRTKEGRAGRQDGKSYRFFAELEALHKISAGGSGGGGNGATCTPNPQPSSTIGFGGLSGGVRFQPTPLSSVAPLSAAPHPAPLDPSSGGGVGVFTNSSSESESETDGEETEEGLVGQKRKRRSAEGGGRGSRKTWGFFKNLMKQLMDQQETMQQRFLETIEKREQDRMMREEAWKRQEMARLTREHEAIAQERAMSASRDAAIIAFLQKITGQAVQLPQPMSVPIMPHQAAPAPTTPMPTQPSMPPAPPPQQKLHQQKQQQQQSTEILIQQAPSSTPAVVQDQLKEAGISGGGGSGDPASSRWPKSEVHALIKLRSGLESRYQDAGPKGPLWEEISTGMKQMGYNRSSKRCKEKWENINKYFKKVKESSKKRPEDAKTCPYFHQLDALYRKKSLGNAGGNGGSASSSRNQAEQEQDPNSQLRTDALPISTLPPPPPQQQVNAEKSNGISGHSGGGAAETTNGELPTGFFEGSAGSGTTMKKPEDIMKELIIEHQHTAIEDYDDKDSDNMDDDDEDDEEDEEEQKMAYKIEFQRPNISGTSNGGTPTSAAAAAAAATAGSFLAMVQ